jgi:hypothetical protein
MTTGELSPRLDGRVDLAKYYSGLKQAENVLLLPHGGATRRPGTRYAGPAKYADRRARLIPFEFSASQVYMLEVGDFYLRLWQDGALVEASPGVPVEVVTVFGLDNLPALQSVQSADILYLVHRDQHPYQLERHSATVWKIRPIPFNPPPSWEYGQRTTTTLTPSATTGAITLTASAAQFEQADIGREVQVTDGVSVGARATITGYTSQTLVDATVNEPFANTDAIAAGSWLIGGSPQAVCTPSEQSPVGRALTLTLAGDGWRTGDVGKYVHVNGGVAVITNLVSALVADATLLSELQGTEDAPAGAWSLEEAAWSVANGFPAAIGFFEDRLWFAGTASQPNTLWGSKSGDYVNFATGFVDDDALEYRLNSRQQNAIQWLANTKVLLAGSTGEEFLISGGQDPLTPSNVQALSQTTYGSAAVAPLRVGNVTLFLQRSRRKLRELTYNFDADGYVAPDLTLLAEHLTAGGLVELAYQQEPDSTVWALRADGVLLAMTYQRDQDVVGWCRQVTRAGDVFESVAVIPHPDGDRDQVWVLVHRWIDGAEVRYVERLDDGAYLFDWPSLQSDCALSYNGVAATTISGLDHLEGELVAIVGDGAVYPEQAVSGGAVTLDPAASVVEVGLPFTATLETMRPEVQVQGTSQGRLKKWSEVIVRLDQTVGVRINGEQLPFRYSFMPMDQGVMPFSGDYRVDALGWDAEGRIRIEQTQPLPLTVLAITGTLLTGDTAEGRD